MNRQKAILWLWKYANKSRELAVISMAAEENVTHLEKDNVNVREFHGLVPKISAYI